VGTTQPARGSPATTDPLRICLLGELRVLRAGHPVALPASKRTRALLGYLVSTGKAETRQALCDLLWDGPDDPRAELRWSLSKLRPVVDDHGATRIAADRERVAFEPHCVETDLAEVRALLDTGIPSATVAVLERASVLLAGEFLDGLELPGCYRFHHWCMGERERHGALRLRVLAALVERLRGDPERALPHARARVAADPSSEPAHGDLIWLLVTMGRPRDAQLQFELAEAMFRREFGVVPGAALREALQPSRQGPRPGLPQLAGGACTPASAPLPVRSFDGQQALVGRSAEQALIADSLASIGNDSSRELLLFVGEPGIGKTRLLDALAAQARRAGCQVLQARCFEAEMMRPYGVWIDALRALPLASLPAALVHDLGPLLAAGSGEAAGPGDRGQLFAASATLVRLLAKSSALVLILDDLQWMDEGSAALLHYLVRSTDTLAALRLAGAARQGEVEDNPWARRMVQSLERDHRLRSCTVGPLQATEVAAWLALRSPALDAAEVHRRSGGNPLLVLALAEAQGVAGAAVDLSWQSLIGDQVQRLDDGPRELLSWASAMGREFRLETLSQAMGSAEAELLTRLARLERQGLLKPSGEGRIDFAHDLVREAVYRQLSQPRRRAIHRQIARALVAAAAADSSLQGELMYHASQADVAPLAVAACIAAAEHCLRVYANAQAVDAAERGLALFERLPSGADRVTAQIALLKLRIVASVGPGDTRLPSLTAEMRAAIGAAEMLGLHAAAASGLHILSWLTQWANDLPSTLEATLRAERLSRAADDATHCLQLANTARCLLEVEGDVGQARALADAAAAQAEVLNLQVIELIWARGLLARWDGDLDLAQRLVRTAVDLARLREDRWREFECLAWLAKIELERGGLDAVDALCEEVSAVATRMRNVTVPLSAALRALAAASRRSTPTVAGALSALEPSLAELRSVDDKAHLAYVLNHAAALELASGRNDEAHAAASEALSAAAAVGRRNEVAVAHALLASVAYSRGCNEEGASHLQLGLVDDAGSNPLSVRARGLNDRAWQCQCGASPARNVAGIPTPAPTKTG
jgi:DNA-binding SARP family transcriptional activator/tetratricopeptide (TPR) repeat protein